MHPPHIKQEMKRKLKKQNQKPLTKQNVKTKKKWLKILL